MDRYPMAIVFREGAVTRRQFFNVNVIFSCFHDSSILLQVIQGIGETACAAAELRTILQ